VNVALFLSCHDPENRLFQASDAQLSRVSEVVKSVKALQAARLFTPGTAADDPYLAQEPAPRLLLQLYFGEIEALEAACGHEGPLQALAGLPFSQQAMLVRSFPVAQPRGPAAGSSTSYVVGYEGPAEDLNAWLAHYIEHHPPLMAKLPGIREIEVCTRLDWHSALPWPHQTWMLRNTVAFDGPAALAEALRSPVRQAMREDYGRLPSFSGEVFHYPMLTRVVR
jgi:uncharacterized protein (TIGR02118 family)